MTIQELPGLSVAIDLGLIVLYHPKDNYMTTEVPYHSAKWNILVEIGWATWYVERQTAIMILC